MFFSFITVITVFSYSMQNHVLLSESAEDIDLRRCNAQEVEKFCLDILNYHQKKDPSFVVPDDIKHIVRAMGRSEMTTEQKKEALNNLMMLRTKIKDKRKREKEKEAEDREILAQYGWVNVDGRDRTKIQKIRRIN